jgi:hypothetical protein
MVYRKNESLLVASKEYVGDVNSEKNKFMFIARQKKKYILANHNKIYPLKMEYTSNIWERH